jgi:hypothetical protein
VAALLVFAPALQQPPIEIAVQQDDVPEVSTDQVDPRSEPIPGSTVETEPTESEQQFPVPIELSSDIALEPLPSWAWWATTFILLGAATILTASHALQTRQSIRQDSPEFRKALRIFQRMLHQPGVTPRDIRRWENHMRFMAEQLRAHEHIPDTLEITLRFLDKKLGSSLVNVPFVQVASEIPEATLIALGAIDFAFPSVLESEGGGTEAAWPLFGEKDTTSDQIRSARKDFERMFTGTSGGFWPNAVVAKRYLKLRRGS